MNRFPSDPLAPPHVDPRVHSALVLCCVLNAAASMHRVVAAHVEGMTPQELYRAGIPDTLDPARERARAATLTAQADRIRESVLFGGLS